MKQKKVFLMCGIPGSGKSTWIQKQREHDLNSSWISRDTVRFSMVGEDEDYFAHENEVFDEFIRYINEGIKLYPTVYIDATHISTNSRNKVLKRLNLKDCEVIPVNFIVSLETAIKRNKNRIGRTKVPNAAIRRMFNQFHPASIDENPLFTEIWTIKEGEK